MIAIRKIKARWRIACAILGLAAGWGIYAVIRPVDEVVLALGEPYEQVRQQSRSTLPAATPYNTVSLYVRRPAILRFSDPQYGFVTPAAKFLLVFADSDGKVADLVLSPQVETLPLDGAMAILVDLQDQFRRGGWRPFRAADDRPIEDTSARRTEIENCLAPTSRWQADDKYQVSLNIRCFRSDNRPNDKRYLITLDLGPPVFDDRPDD